MGCHLKGVILDEKWAKQSKAEGFQAYYQQMQLKFVTISQL